MVKKSVTQVFRNFDPKIFVFVDKGTEKYVPVTNERLINMEALGFGNKYGVFLTEPNRPHFDIHEYLNKVIKAIEKLPNSGEWLIIIGRVMMTVGE